MTVGGGRVFVASGNLWRSVKRALKGRQRPRDYPDVAPVKIEGVEMVTAADRAVEAIVSAAVGSLELLFFNLIQSYSLRLTSFPLHNSTASSALADLRLLSSVWPLPFSSVHQNLPSSVRI